MNNVIGNSAGAPYDILIVGSSPLSLIEAVTEACTGRRVCIVEQDDRIGGAWKTEDCLGLVGIETTPHVFLPENRAYSVLDKYLLSNFRTLDIQPRLLVKRHGWFFKNANISLDNRLRAGLALSLALKWDTKRNKPAKRVLATATFALNRLADVLRQPVAYSAKYPAGGLTNWFETVKSILKARDVNLLLNSQVKTVSSSNSLVSTELSGGRILYSSKVVLNRHVQIDAIYANDGPIPIASNLAVSNHYSFIVGNSAPRGFIHAIGHSDIMLVNDVSDYAPNLDDIYPGCRLITLRTNARPESHRDDPDFYFTALKSMGYLPQRSHLIQHYHREIVVKKLTGLTIKLLKQKMGTSVKFLLADDLSIMSPIAQYYN
jgi:hypothetical protein